MPGTYEDYPFDDITDAGAWPVMRHCVDKKGFDHIYERNGQLYINLKHNPFEADFLRQTYGDVTPAYHMNKTHWNGIAVDGDVPVNEIKRMIENSYDLIKPKVEKKR